MTLHQETKQDVFNTLSDLEQFFFCLKNDPCDLAGHEEELTKLHDEARMMLKHWHELTGCVNQ